MFIIFIWNCKLIIINNINIFVAVHSYFDTERPIRRKLIEHHDMKTLNLLEIIDS